MSNLHGGKAHDLREKHIDLVSNQGRFEYQQCYFLVLSSWAWLRERVGEYKRPGCGRKGSTRVGLGSHAETCGIHSGGNRQAWNGFEQDCFWHCTFVT